MARNITFTLIVFASLLTACSEKPPAPAEARAESAGEALKNDSRAIAERFAAQKAATDANFQQESARAERARFVDALTVIAQRWPDAFAEVGRTGRSDLAPAIKKLEAIKAEVDAAAVSDCTGQARATLSASMGMVIDTYNQFRQATGNADDSMQQKLQQAAEKFRDYEKQVGACR